MVYDITSKESFEALETYWYVRVLFFLVNFVRTVCQFVISLFYAFFLLVFNIIFSMVNNFLMMKWCANDNCFTVINHSFGNRNLPYN